MTALDSEISPSGTNIYLPFLKISLFFSENHETKNISIKPTIRPLILLGPKVQSLQSPDGLVYFKRMHQILAENWL